MDFGKVMVGHSNLTPPFAYLWPCPPCIEDLLDSGHDEKALSHRLVNEDVHAFVAVVQFQVGDGLTLLDDTLVLVAIQVQHVLGVLSFFQTGLDDVAL